MEGTNTGVREVIRWLCSLARREVVNKTVWSVDSSSPKWQAAQVSNIAHT